MNLFLDYADKTTRLQKNVSEMIFRKCEDIIYDIRRGRNGSRIMYSKEIIDRSFTKVEDKFETLRSWCDVILGYFYIYYWR